MSTARIRVTNVTPRLRREEMERTGRVVVNRVKTIHRLNRAFVPDEPQEFEVWTGHLDYRTLLAVPGLEVEVLEEIPDTSEGPLSGEALAAAEREAADLRKEAARAAAEQDALAGELAAAQEVLRGEQTTVDEARLDAALRKDARVEDVPRGTVDEARRRVEDLATELWGARCRTADLEASAAEAMVPVAAGREAQRLADVRAAEEAVQEAQRELARVRQEADSADKFLAEKLAKAAREALTAVHAEGPAPSAVGVL